MKLGCDFFLTSAVGPHNEDSCSFEARERAAWIARRLPDDHKLNNIKTNNK